MNRNLSAAAASTPMTVQTSAIILQALLLAYPFFVFGCSTINTHLEIS